MFLGTASHLDHIEHTTVHSPPLHVEQNIHIHHHLKKYAHHDYRNFNWIFNLELSKSMKRAHTHMIGIKNVLERGMPWLKQNRWNSLVKLKTLQKTVFILNKNKDVYRMKTCF